MLVTIASAFAPPHPSLGYKTPAAYAGSHLLTAQGYRSVRNQHLVRIAERCSLSALLEARLSKSKQNKER